MFWSSPSGDVNTTFFLIGVSFVIALVVLFFSKKKILSLLIFSLLSNLIIFIQYQTGSLMFRVYDLYWLRDLARFYWPILNIFLLAILIFNFWKDVKNKK